MGRIVLDFGSGNTCKNDLDYAKRMIDEMDAVNTKKHEVIIKWQLFKKAGDNIPLLPHVFSFAYYYAKKLGYATTASVFDKESLEYLLKYEVPFVKIANNRSLDWLVGEIPRNIPVYCSFSNGNLLEFTNRRMFYDVETLLCCVSKYPTTKDMYIDTFSPYQLIDAISDHTSNWELYDEYMPKVYEVHYKLEDSTGLDAGDFARTPEQLKHIL